jgi:2-polyprenyl-3-methyl-5-hydroxy-6-metoxy-1,4-benzoquinol methylase
MTQIKKILIKTGLDKIYEGKDFYQKKIYLRDGRETIIHINVNDGHGLLDYEFWEDSDYYIEKYRDEFSSKLEKYTLPEEHLNIYEEINKRQFKQFENDLTEDTNLLEIGSSFGGILNQITKKKINEIDAIEPNINDFEFCKEKFKNVNLYNNTFENQNFEFKKYDFIVSFEVLEHVINLDTFLSKVSSLLKKGGIVNFEVPNHDDSLLKNYEVEFYKSFFYHKAHIHYFTPKSLKKIFSFYKIEGEVSGFQMYPFYNQIFWIYNNKPQKDATEALNFPKFKMSKENNFLHEFFHDTNLRYLNLVEERLISDCLVFKGIKI